MKRNKLMLLILALVFAAPGLAAYLLYSNPQWMGKATTNKGHLLSSLQPFTSFGGQPKWRLIFWNSGACKKNCHEQLEKLARIRLALGRHLYEVDLWLFLSGQKTNEARIQDMLRDQDIRSLRLSAQQEQHLKLAGKPSQIFIASPEDYLVMSYTQTAKSGDIFHDIKQLLNTTKKHE